VGENPLDIERITEKLHKLTFWVGRGGAMTHAISAINIALWDLAGKLLGQPVWRLLGGSYRSVVPVYGSILFRPVETLEQRIEEMLRSGFRAIKLGWDPFGRQALAEDEGLVRIARRAAGDGVRVMIDAGGSDPLWKLRYKDALERARMLHDHDIAWFEEPLQPDDLEGYTRLTDASPVKIAHGEVLTRRQSFAPYFSRRAMDIAQPDVTKAGGLSEMRRIAWMAEQQGIEIVPHGWNTAVGVAADIQFVSTLPAGSLVEFNHGNALVEELVANPFKLDGDGNLRVPDTPGLGIEVDRDRLARFSASGYASGTWTWDENRDFEPPAD
jgi:D-galactarolactone cycloisomerase